MDRKHFYSSMKPDENMAWCKPVRFESGNRRVTLVICEGIGVGLAFWKGGRRVHPEGEILLGDTKIKDFDDSENPVVAKIASFLKVESLLDARMEELGCRSCPWRTNCCAMYLPWKQEGFATGTFGPT